METILNINKFSSFRKNLIIKKAPQKIAKIPQDFNQVVIGAER